MSEHKLPKPEIEDEPLSVMIIITGLDFMHWRRVHGLSVGEASKILGWSKDSIERAEEVFGLQLPKYITLACLALDAGLTVGLGETEQRQN